MMVIMELMVKVGRVLRIVQQQVKYHLLLTMGLLMFLIQVIYEEEQELMGKVGPTHHIIQHQE